MFTFFTRSPCRTGTPGVFFASELPVGAIDEKPEKLDVEKKVTRHPLFALGEKLPARSDGLGAVLARHHERCLVGLTEIAKSKFESFSTFFGRKNRRPLWCFGHSSVFSKVAASTGWLLGRHQRQFGDADLENLAEATSEERELWRPVLGGLRWHFQQHFRPRRPARRCRSAFLPIGLVENLVTLSAGSRCRKPTFRCPADLAIVLVAQSGGQCLHFRRARSLLQLTGPTTLTNFLKSTRSKPQNFAF